VGGVAVGGRSARGGEMGVVRLGVRKGGMDGGERGEVGGGQGGEHRRKVGGWWGREGGVVGGGGGGGGDWGGRGG